MIVLLKMGILFLVVGLVRSVAFGILTAITAKGRSPWFLVCLSLMCFSLGIAGSGLVLVATYFMT